MSDQQGSPPSFCPASRTLDLEAILSIISEAQRFVHIAVMDYFPTMYFAKPQRWTWRTHMWSHFSFQDGATVSAHFVVFFFFNRYWSLIDDTIRAAAFERKVKIRMLISCGKASDPAMLPFLQSLAALDNHKHGISVQIVRAKHIVSNDFSCFNFFFLSSEIVHYASGQPDWYSILQSQPQ